MRMYETTIRTAVVLAPSEHEEDLMNHLRLNKDRIEFVVSVVGAGYEADRLSRALPAWMDLLEDSAMSAHTAVALLHDATPDSYNFCAATRASPQLRDLVPYFLGEEKAAAVGETEGVSVRAVHTLSNGVQMPVVGLGTWQLQGKECKDAVSAAIAAGYRYSHNILFCPQLSTYLLEQSYFMFPVTDPSTPLRLTATRLMWGLPLNLRLTKES